MQTKRKNTPFRSRWLILLIMLIFVGGFALGGIAS